jgi:hypothetical protein
VLDALVVLWSGTAELAELVQDGPVPLDIADLEVLSVGDDGSDDGTTVNGAFSPEGMGSRPDREQFEVTCLIVVVDGAGDIKAARTRAYELLSAAAEALAGDRTLGGLVLRASMADHTLRQLQDNRGGVVRVEFTVAIDAYTVR